MTIKEQFNQLKMLLIEIEKEHGIKVTDIRASWSTEYAMGTGRFCTLTDLQINTTN